MGTPDFFGGGGGGGYKSKIPPFLKKHYENEKFKKSYVPAEFDHFFHPRD